MLPTSGQKIKSKHIFYHKAIIIRVTVIETSNITPKFLLVVNDS